MIFSHKNGIYFRKLTETDLSNLLLLKDESWFGTHRVSILNIEDQKRWFDNLDKNPHTPAELYLVAQVGDQISVGLFKLQNIDWQNRRAEAGWDVYKQYRGRGFGKKIVEAGVSFSKEVLSLNRLRAEILVTNEASIKCAEKAGFKQEGLEKQAILKGGKFVDNLIYGIILGGKTFGVDVSI